MMAEGGEIAALGRTPEVMGVIARYGDPAMEFIWRHKGALAVSTALTAFLANPQPFIDGTTQVTGTVAENAVRPAVVAAGNVAQEAAGFIRWSLTMLVAALAVGLGFAVKNGAFTPKEHPLRHEPRRGPGWLKTGLYIAKRLFR